VVSVRRVPVAGHPAHSVPTEQLLTAATNANDDEEPMRNYLKALAALIAFVFVVAPPPATAQGTKVVDTFTAWTKYSHWWRRKSAHDHCIRPRLEAGSLPRPSHPPEIGCER